MSRGRFVIAPGIRLCAPCDYRLELGDGAAAVAAVLRCGLPGAPGTASPLKVPRERLAAVAGAVGTANREGSPERGKFELTAEGRLR